jgi:hypothetical protein
VRGPGTPPNPTGGTEGCTARAGTDASRTALAALALAAPTLAVLALPTGTALAAWARTGRMGVHWPHRRWPHWHSLPAPRGPLAPAAVPGAPAPLTGLAGLRLPSCTPGRIFRR